MKATLVWLLPLLLCNAITLADDNANYTGKPYSSSPVEIPATVKATENDFAPDNADNIAEVKLPAGDVVMQMKIDAVAGVNIESITLSKTP